MPIDGPTTEDKETWGSEETEIKKPVDAEEAKPQVPQEQERQVSIERSRIKEKEHQQAENEAKRLLERNGIPGDAEKPKTMEEFLKKIISGERDVKETKKNVQAEAKEKLTKSATPLSDVEINDMILTFNEQFIQTNKDTFTDQSEETKNKIIAIYAEQLKAYMLAEIDKKIAEHQQNLKDLETTFDQRSFSGLESEKTFIVHNSKKEEVSVNVILKKIDLNQFSPTKLLEAYIKQDQGTLTKYQQIIQRIYQDYGLTEDEAKAETKKLYEKQVQEFEKEIARRDDLRKKLERLEGHRKAIEGLEGADMLRYSRAVQGDQTAYDELKNNEKTKGLIAQFEQQQRENGRRALNLKTREETKVWEETMDLALESHGNLSATVLKDRVALDYRAFANDDPIRCILKRDQKTGLVLTPDLEHEFWDAGVQNPFFDQQAFSPKRVRSGEEILKTIKDYKKVVEFQILLHHPDIFDQLSVEEKEDLREVFSKPENCLHFISFVEEHYAKLRPERSLKELLKEIFLPIVEKLHKPPENFFFENVQVMLDPDHIIAGAWLKSDGSLREANLNADLRTIASLNRDLIPLDDKSPPPS